ncbi:MAG: hypothetical protein ACR2OB_13310 [Solirubrobacteraceae bacterium]
MTLQPGDTKDAFASCAAGERLVGGGYLGSGIRGFTVEASSPAPSDPTRAWFVRARNDNAMFAPRLTVSAICVKVG